MGEKPTINNTVLDTLTLTVTLVNVVVRRYTKAEGNNTLLYSCLNRILNKGIAQVAPVAQRYHVTSDTLGREFDPGKRDFSH